MAELFLPEGFRAKGWHIGVKESNSSKEDFGVIFSEVPAASHAVFTRNRYPGHPVVVGRRHIEGGRLRLIVVNSGNANVANGPEGLALAEAECQRAAASLQIPPTEVLPCSTGVIGRPMPAEKILNACDAIRVMLEDSDPLSFVRAIMTTDRFPKYRCMRSSPGFTLTGMAKGAGMIEPDMATMLAFMLTDIEIHSDDLRRWVSFLADRSFNRISVDSDTSTSDTFALLANGASGIRVHIRPEDIFSLRSMAFDDLETLLQSLYVTDPAGLVEASNFLQNRLNTDPTSAAFMASSMQIALYLALQIVRDGEGATRIFRVIVRGARDQAQALKIGRSVLNSPLVKTAVAGGDPNWGRIIAAVGKVFDEYHPDPEISVGPYRMYPPGQATPADIEKEMKREEIDFTIHLGAGNAYEILYGCDLTEAYVRLNSQYTT
jgi:glutamate N-acetyltransferase/amino-acid N-acetyltransferase